MKTLNSIFCLDSNSYLARRRTLYGVLLIILLGISCAQTPKIDEMARKEAESLANEASALYKKSQQSVSFDNKYSWMMAVGVDDAKTRNGKFASAAKDLDSTRDKFLQASTKMTEAMNGQTRLDSEEARDLWNRSNSYKMWAEMAEFERKTLQEATAVTDPKALEKKMTEAQEERDQMNKNLMAQMRVSSS